ncbi:hypothetical protein RF11_00230 [Thelohanellus kitauei]|uniref:Uncharacterized protein n=1 Tax=Thelohanellus kitauei TaxID=669202 RepID=A0A0C2NEG9_THEKT|nr:hypothetical protein RF11_00230 [Thelohanellus kitauei]
MKGLTLVTKYQSHDQLFSRVEDLSNDIIDNLDRDQLLVYVRAVNETFVINQELASMSSNMAVPMVKMYFKLSIITTDIALSTIGRKAGYFDNFISHLQGLGISTEGRGIYHSIINQEYLCARELKLDQVMKNCYHIGEFHTIKWT